mmetsp:Transcript_16389/g.20025  ORF Transcript_16389/g.20025 Transcript_16389/m.20025 type:complete len:136 (-) Transcript_16389:149-556(-)
MSTETTKPNQQPLPSQGLLDLLLFFSIFWMVFFHDGNKRDSSRGRWKPNMMYVPVLLLRWVFLPHRDWMKEHTSHYNDDWNKVHHHHHRSHQGHHHQQHVHNNHHQPYPNLIRANSLDKLSDDGLDEVMDEIFGQ